MHRLRRKALHVPTGLARPSSPRAPVASLLCTSLGSGPQRSIPSLYGGADSPGSSSGAPALGETGAVFQPRAAGQTGLCLPSACCLQPLSLWGRRDSGSEISPSPETVQRPPVVATGHGPLSGGVCRAAAQDGSLLEGGTRSCWLQGAVPGQISLVPTQWHHKGFHTGECFCREKRSILRSLKVHNLSFLIPNTSPQRQFLSLERQRLYCRGHRWPPATHVPSSRRA